MPKHVTITVDEDGKLLGATVPEGDLDLIVRIDVHHHWTNMFGGGPEVIASYDHERDAGHDARVGFRSRRGITDYDARTLIEAANQTTDSSNPARLPGRG